MPLPYISQYRPTVPLLIWTLVSAACGLVLVIEVAALAVRGGWTGRLFAVVPVVVSVAAFLLASQIWASYLGIACPYPDVQSHPISCFNPSRAAQAVARFQPLGWTTVATTAVLVAAGAASRLMRRRDTRRARL
jgi:hypothetical protein